GWTQRLHADVSHDAVVFETHGTCSPKPAYAPEEHPICKLVGIFTEERRTSSVVLDQGYFAQDRTWVPKDAFKADG
ncbi:MAG: hypothetical protein MUQ10_03365, partial [Anaerolineae bacterium]|nr:hypothetical protein [Anaerolineae bacterium]